MVERLPQLQGLNLQALRGQQHMALAQVCQPPGTHHRGCLHGCRPRQGGCRGYPSSCSPGHTTGSASADNLDTAPASILPSPHRGLQTNNRNPGVWAGLPSLDPTRPPRGQKPGEGTVGWQTQRNCTGLWAVSQEGLYRGRRHSRVSTNV